MGNTLKDPVDHVDDSSGDRIEIMLVGPDGQATEISPFRLLGALFRPAPVHDFDPGQTIRTEHPADQGVENSDAI